MRALLLTFSWQELRHHPWRNAAAAIAVMVARISASSCSAERKKRSRAARSGTTGKRIGWTFTPASNSAAAIRAAATELPRITGTMPRPAEPPVSKPASRASARNSAAFACSRATRQGSACITASDSSAAAASGGASPTE